MSQDPEGMELSSREPIRKYSLLIALGGNLGSSVGAPQETLKSALKLLQTSGAERARKAVSFKGVAVVKPSTTNSVDEFVV